MSSVEIQALVNFASGDPSVGKMDVSSVVKRWTVAAPPAKIQQPTCHLRKSDTVESNSALHWIAARRQSQ
ncbi:hypothetical protein E4U32_005759 [Claviceps aff. humidiphila group G2b]|nr:hypothetical protein E4U32_005759 [Claviceps aff. humidiphila group G2b]